MKILLSEICEFNAIIKSNHRCLCILLYSYFLNGRLDYVHVNMTKRSLPSNVMPLFRHLDEDGRCDLRRAISKFGGVKYIATKANLIQIDECQKRR